MSITETEGVYFEKAYVIFQSNKKHPKHELRLFTLICQDLVGIVAVPTILDGFIVKVKSLQSELAST